MSAGNDGSPAIANGVIYIANGSLYAFDAAGSANCSGTPTVCAPLWTTVISGGTTPSAPAVADGIVYVGTSRSGLAAFDATGSANCSTGPTAKTCAPLWTAPSASSIGTPAVAYGVVYTVTGGGTLSAFAAAGPGKCPGTTTAATCTRAPLWTSATSVYATSSPAVANGVVYVSGTGSGGTYAYDAAGSLHCSVSGTGKTCSPLWSAATGSANGGSPAVVNGVLFVNDHGSGEVYAYSP